MKYLVAATALLAVSTFSAKATTVVDFSTNNGVLLNSGDIIDDFNFGGGIVGDVTATGGILEAVIFDAAKPTGGDYDLADPFEDVDNPGTFESFGKALIVQENAGNPIVADDAVGGTLSFAFDNLITLVDIALLDVEEGTIVSLFDAAGGLLATQTGGVDNSGFRNAALTRGTQNQFIRFDFNVTGVKRLLVDFNGSGAVGEFRAAVVPLPAPILLLLSGVAGLALIGRRRHQLIA